MNAILLQPRTSAGKRRSSKKKPTTKKSRGAIPKSASNRQADQNPQGSQNLVSTKATAKSEIRDTSSVIARAHHASQNLESPHGTTPLLSRAKSVIVNLCNDSHLGMRLDANVIFLFLHPPHT